MSEQDYVLGTHDAEIERLGLQHRVWRPRMLDAWRRAGFREGLTIADLGSGPGFATLDLAEIAGRDGRVFACERSRRFLDHLGMHARQRGLTNIEPCLADLDEAGLPVRAFDAVWCRWVFAFVTRPRDLAAGLAAALRPGGVAVIHEYLDYGTWRYLSRQPALEGFVAAVMASWRAVGGEPDIGRDLPGWLEAEGLQLVELRPIVEVMGQADYGWSWLEGFVRVNTPRLRDLGVIDDDAAGAIMAAIDAVCSEGAARVVSPSVLEIVARKPA